MKAIYALYTEPADVQKAVDNLRAAGVAEPEIVVISSEPIEEYEFSHRDKATWLYSIAAAGGAAGLRVRDVAHADERTGVASADRQHADRVVVAEHDRDVRADDARRHPGHGRDAVHHGQDSEPRTEALRPEGVGRQDSRRHREPLGGVRAGDRAGARWRAAARS